MSPRVPRAIPKPRLSNSTYGIHTRPASFSRIDDNANHFHLKAPCPTPPSSIWTPPRWVSNKYRCPIGSSYPIWLSPCDMGVPSRYGCPIRLAVPYGCPIQLWVSNSPIGPVRHMAVSLGWSLWRCQRSAGTGAPKYGCPFGLRGQMSQNCGCSMRPWGWVSHRTYGCPIRLWLSNGHGCRLWVSLWAYGCPIGGTCTWVSRGGLGRPSLAGRGRGGSWFRCGRGCRGACRLLSARGRCGRTCGAGGALPGRGRWISGSRSA